MQGLAGGFWWANVIGCAFGTLYWARQRRNDGTPGLMTPGGQVWAWQLVFCFIVLALDVSPWHLFWLGLVSIVLSVIVSNVWRGRMLASRYPDVGRIEVPAHRLCNRCGTALPPSARFCSACGKDTQSGSRTDDRFAHLIRKYEHESWIEITAANYLADDLSKQAFFTFTRESPAMKLAFHDAWGQTLSPTRPLTRGRLTIIFNDLGVQLASSGDIEGSDRSFACSCLFIKRNPLTWVALAEVALAKEDRMAATWAGKVIKFQLDKSTSHELKEFLATDEAEVLLQSARQRMQEIVATCKVCTWWHDSTEVFNQMGIAHLYFDR